MSVAVEEKIESKCISGIYKIVNKINGKIYVGSAIDLDRRKRDHFNSLKSNTHYNKHLQRSFNKYKIDNFVFEILEFVIDKNKLLEREQYWIDTLNVVNPKIGYNISPTAGSCLGVKASEETRKKMSELRKGENNSFYGKCHTKVTKEKLSKNKKGKNLGEENHFYGKHHTDEAKEKISESRKEYVGEKHPMWGKKHTVESIEKMSQANKGKHLSEETRKKISETDKLNKLHVGEDNPGAKLTINEVVKIKKLLKENILTQSKIAKMFGVSQTAISKINLNKKWKHINLEDYLDENGNLKEII